MNLNLTDPQAEELDRVLQGALGDLSHEIAATDNARYRAKLIARRKVLDSIAAQVQPGTWFGGPEGSEDHRAWIVEIVFAEDEDCTRADALLHAVAERERHARGLARRNPVDPNVPAIGEELAAARALSDLSHQLVDAAAHELEAFEEGPVGLGA